MSNTVTLGLDGDVALGKFSQAALYFSLLIENLSQTLEEEAPIEWLVEELHINSPSITALGISAKPQSIEHVVRAYERVGQALVLGEPIPYPAHIAESAHALFNLLDMQIHAIRFETDQKDFILSNTPDAVKSIQYFRGSVKGRVEALNRRRGLRFTLYDPLFDKAITCYLDSDSSFEEQMRSIWGRRVRVTGKIGREPDKQVPSVVREVQKIEILPDSDPYSYVEARGVLRPYLSMEESPEAAIRRWRDIFFSKDVPLAP